MEIFSLELNTNTQINLETGSRIKYTVDHKNVTINFATAMDEIITTHSEGHAYLG